MGHDEFVDLVKRMRKTQRAYFARRDPGVLQESKLLERQVDQALQDMAAKPQPSLFDDDRLDKELPNA